ncbi:hypothetical protein [Planomonospora sphaerica]|nr:hypothetical protein [Planomonospora sphaerica]
MKELHASTLDVAEWACPDTAAWIRSRCNAPAVLDQRPVLPSSR